jgi:hypothetical protein
MRHIKPLVATLALSLLATGHAATEQVALKSDNLQLSGWLRGHYLHDKIGTESRNTVAIQNANIWMNAKISPELSAHFNLLATDADHNLRLDEAYVGYQLQPKVSLEVGRTYTAFGQKNDPYTVAPTLTQVLTQAHETVVALAANNEDVYGRVWAYNHEVGTSQWAKWGAGLGLNHQIAGVDMNVDASWLNDIRTLSGQDAFENFVATDLATFDRHAAWTTHAGMRVAGMNAVADYTSSVGRISEEAKPRVWHVGAGYGFVFMGHQHDVHVGYEQASHLSETVLKHKIHRSVGYQVDLTNHVDGVVSYDHYTPFAAADRIKQVNVALEAKF